MTNGERDMQHAAVTLFSEARRTTSHFHLYPGTFDMLIGIQTHPVFPRVQLSTGTELVSYSDIVVFYGNLGPSQSPFQFGDMQAQISEPLPEGLYQSRLTDKPMPYIPRKLHAQSGLLFVSTDVLHPVNPDDPVVEETLFDIGMIIGYKRMTVLNTDTDMVNVWTGTMTVDAKQNPVGEDIRKVPLDILPDAVQAERVATFNRTVEATTELFRRMRTKEKGIIIKIVKDAGQEPQELT